MPKFVPLLYNSLKHNSKLFLCGIGVTALFSLLYIFEPPLFRYLELRFYDTVLREYPISRPAADVIIVDIDERSLKEFGQWPWPRSIVADLLKKINAHGPSVIGVDLLFAEPDRTSLHAVLEHIKETYGSSPRIENIPPVCMNNDCLLVETLRTGPFVLSQKFLFNEETATSTDCLFHPIPAMIAAVVEPSLERRLFHQASGVVCNLPMFDAVATANGFVNVSFDIDGLIRRIPLIIQYASGNQNPEYFPSLALAAIMKHKNMRQVSVNVNSGKPYEVLLGDTVIPVDGIGNMLIHYRDKEKAFPYISAADILSNRLPGSFLKDKLVFVGTSATGLGEKRSTPLHPFLPGVEIHATVAQNILHSNFVQRPSWIPGLEFFFILLAGFLSTVLFIRTNAKWSLLLLLALSVVLWFTSYWSFSKTEMIASPLIPLLTVAANFSLLSLTKFWHSECALRRSENQYRSIFDNALEGICRITPEGKIVAANQAFARMMGFETSADMSAAITHIQSIRFDNPGYSFKILKSLKKTGVIRSFETEIYTKNGSKIWVSINARATKNDDNVLYYEGSVEDISERKLLEERLMRAEKMEVLGTMAGGVAHDLNNVLGVLVGYSELMMLKIPKEDPLWQFADNIYHSGVKGAAIIQDLLTLARRGVNVSDVVNLNLVLSEYLTTPEFGKLRDDHPLVTFRTELHENLMNIKGSPVHLSKTVMNLVANAAEAISGQGEVLMQTNNCYLDAPIRGYEDVKEGDYVVLSVSDTGHGISPHDLEKIFEPFYTKKVMGKSGTGLGLAVVWGTIKDHAGYIDVQSKEGAGSIFTLFFPATREGLSEGKENVSPDQYKGSGETILVVDDMEGQRELAVSMLTKLNYKVNAVASGEEAVSYLKSHQTDLLLLDMFMEPGIDGLETYRQVREINPHQRAVIISGYTETEQVRKIQELGAGGFIRKPYVLENIGMAIRKELQKA